MMHLIRCEEEAREVERETSRGWVGGRKVEARTEMLAPSTPPTGPRFSHQRAMR